MAKRVIDHLDLEAEREGNAIKGHTVIRRGWGKGITKQRNMHKRGGEILTTRVVNRMDQHTARTLEHLDMVKKTTEERNQAAKETLIEVFYTTFIKWVDDANESVTLDQKIATIKDMVANLRSSIGA